MATVTTNNSIAQAPQLAVVLGSTGVIGGGAARSLLAAGWAVICPVRNPTSDDAAELSSLGATVFKADLALESGVETVSVAVSDNAVLRRIRLVVSSLGCSSSPTVPIHRSKPGAAEAGLASNLITHINGWRALGHLLIRERVDAAYVFMTGKAGEGGHRGLTSVADAGVFGLVTSARYEAAAAQAPLRVTEIRLFFKVLSDKHFADSAPKRLALYDGLTEERRPVRCASDFAQIFMALASPAHAGSEPASDRTYHAPAAATASHPASTSPTAAVVTSPLLGPCSSHATGSSVSILALSLHPTRADERIESVSSSAVPCNHAAPAGLQLGGLRSGGLLRLVTPDDLASVITALGHSYQLLPDSKDQRPRIGAERQLMCSRTRPGAPEGLAMRLATAALREPPAVPFASLYRDATRGEVLAYFRHAWGMTTAAFQLLRSDATLYSPHNQSLDRRPMIFYYGHPAAVLLQKLTSKGLLNLDRRLPATTASFVRRLMPIFDLRNPTTAGAATTGCTDTQAQLYDADYPWPTAAEVDGFREIVRFLVEDIISSDMPSPIDLRPRGITDESPWWAVLMGIEHERITLESSLALIRRLPLSCLVSVDESEAMGWRVAPSRINGERTTNSVEPMLQPNDADTVVLDGTAVELCSAKPPEPLPAPTAATATDCSNTSSCSIKPVSSSAVCDAEWEERLALRSDALRACARNGTRRVDVGPFAASKRLVSNAEFLEFCRSTGAPTPPFWVHESAGCGDHHTGGATGGHASSSTLLPAAPQRFQDPPLTSRSRRGHCMSPDEPASYLPPCMQLRVVHRLIEMPWSWPVEVDLQAALAYIQWKNRQASLVDGMSGGGAAAPARPSTSTNHPCRLPTEAEFVAVRHQAAGSLDVENPACRCHPDCTSTSREANGDLRFHSPGAQSSLQSGARRHCQQHLDTVGRRFSVGPNSVSSVGGNTWEWVVDDDPLLLPASSASTTATSAFAALGGCWASNGDPATSSRYAAGSRPGSATLQLGGFRCVYSCS